MQVSICTDNSKIIGVCPDDMTGNTGWQTTTDTALTAHTGKTYEEMFSGLYDEHGIALYKFIDGYAENRTQAEIDADIAAIPALSPTTAERLAALEALELERMMSNE